MKAELDTVERRVLGALIEKSLAQPDYYPMTLNALLASCNQKNNRDPEMALDEQAIWDALERLRLAGLTSKILPGPGTRTERFKHEALSGYGWGPRQQAVMAELLLRGPQTVGELRGRGARLFAFESVEAVATTLDGLAQADPPMAGPLPRVPGQSATRFTHRLYPPGEAPEAGEAAAGSVVGGRHEATRPAAASAPAPSATAAGRADPADRAPLRPAVPDAAAEPGDDDASVSELRIELENVQTEIAELHEELAALRRRIDMLEAQRG